MSTARNVAIVLVLAAAVAFLPGGGTTAGLVGAILSTLIMVSLVFFAYRFYREHRLELDGLGDRWRGLLYGAIGVVVLALAALPRLPDSSGGTLVVVALLGGGRVRVLRRLAPLPRVRLIALRPMGRPRAKMSPASHGARAPARATIEGEVV